MKQPGGAKTSGSSSEKATKPHMPQRPLSLSRLVPEILQGWSSCRDRQLTVRAALLRQPTATLRRRRTPGPLGSAAAELRRTGRRAGGGGSSHRPIRRSARDDRVGALDRVAPLLPECARVALLIPHRDRRQRDGQDEITEPVAQPPDEKRPPRPFLELVGGRAVVSVDAVGLGFHGGGRGSFRSSARNSLAGRLLPAS